MIPGTHYQGFALEKIANPVGTPPPELAGIDVLPEPWSAHWILSPTAEPRALEGTVLTEGAIVSKENVNATKRSEFL